MNKAIKAITQKEYATERLILGELNNNDVTFIRELTNSEGWLKFIGDRNINSPEQAKEYIDKIEESLTVKYWKVSIKENQIPIGVITLIQRDYLDDVDIGFAFLPQFSKKGYAYEAAKNILDEVLPKTDTENIYATTIHDNIHSISLLEKLGLSKKKTLNRDGEILELYALSMDQLAINELVQHFFKVFNNKNGHTPNWDHFRELCIPEVSIVKKQKLEQEIYDLNSFIAPRKKILMDGSLIDFEEYEKEEETKIIGNLAQRYSTYRKKGILNGTAFEGSGNKLFQLIKTRQGWKISSIIWEDH